MIYRARWVIPRVGEEFENGEILVRNGAIAEVGSNLAGAHSDEEVRDLGECALLPGFVNAHSHIDYTHSRGAADALNLWEWIDTVGFGPRRKPDYGAVALSAALGAAECALGGITCLGDATFTGAAAEAMQSVGLRGIAYREVFGQRMGADYEARFAEALNELMDARSRCSPLVRLGISPHSIYTSNHELLNLCAETCTKLRIPVAVHLAETSAEAGYALCGSGPIADWRRGLGFEPMASGLTPVRHAAEAGLLREGVCLAHCVHLSEDEVELVARSGVGVAHCPRSNGYLGAGVAPAPSMLRAGVRLGLGTDSAGSCLTIDMFEEMRFALGVHRAAAKDAGVITAKDVLRAATVGGAAALGLADSIGTLDSGKRADIVAIDLSDRLPGEDLYLSIVRRSPANVALVVVDGVEIAQRGRLLTLDIRSCRENLRAALDKEING